MYLNDHIDARIIVIHDFQEFTDLRYLNELTIGRLRDTESPSQLTPLITAYLTLTYIASDMHIPPGCYAQIYTLHICATNSSILFADPRSQCDFVRIQYDKAYSHFAFELADI